MKPSSRQSVNPGRIVVKVGTSTLTDSDGRIDRAYIQTLAASLVGLHRTGWQPLLVTSGAIRAGREALESASGRESTEHSGKPRRGRQPSSIPERVRGISDNPPRKGPGYLGQPLTVPYKQAAAAIGQGLLMHSYSEAFGSLGITTGQVLLTRDDLADRRRFLNARNTLSALLSLGVIPIINENDTVAVDEIRFGDNDTLAARVAVLVEAELLLILSDVEGLYQQEAGDQAVRRSGGPAVRRSGGQGAGGALIPEVRRITRDIEELASGAGSYMATGGMVTKLEAAKIATAAGIRTVIAHGRRGGVIEAVAAGEQIGTAFLAGSGKPRGRKRWIAAGSRIHGAIHVNAGAAERLRTNSASLLAVGIKCVEGDFDAGELVELRDESGHRFARGLSNYAAADVRQLQGLQSDQFRSALGYSSGDEIVHRDNMVVES